MVRSNSFKETLCQYISRNSQLSVEQMKSQNKYLICGVYLDQGDKIETVRERERENERETKREREREREKKERER